MATEEGQRKLTAILVADVAGFSRLAGADEERTLARSSQRPHRPHNRPASRACRQAAQGRSAGWRQKDELILRRGIPLPWGEPDRGRGRARRANRIISSPMCFVGSSSHYEGSLRCPSFFNPIVKRRAGSLARSRAESWFSAWRWRRLRPLPAWGAAPEEALAQAALELRPERAAAERGQAGARALGAAQQFIARMAKPNLRPALGAWFGTQRIECAWPETAAYCLSTKLQPYRTRRAPGALSMRPASR
jgi:hypothetical protein